MHYLSGNSVDVPVHFKTDRIPYLPQWRQHRWAILYSLLSFAIHHIWLFISGEKCLSKAEAFLLYFVLSTLIAIREVFMFHGLGIRYGFLDGDTHARDTFQKVGLRKGFAHLLKATGSRTILMIFVSYTPCTPPAVVLSNWVWWMNLVYEIGLYGLVLDFWFYWYHRAMHEIGSLWEYHRTHHSTRYPTTFLTGLAGHEQEFFDLIGIPLMTYITLRAVGIRFGFYEWWVCQRYVAQTEIGGHSGIRVYATAPSTVAWLLKAFNVEIAIEDHDLHHRKGGRKGFNYGKQSRLWDRVFGTCHDRIESVEANIDYTYPAQMPFS
ncbi:hypothetical protein CFAM422_000955 [Trichoderma lentiforme]|uniref:Fatty acid hydroxylase domain-containing protein n=1 Tax=Trichoderma lentiforme TaxID=1567552 RepID=A0A9P4XQ24_9HYPO|nr:hypothetical protein CFAM422_000955 [Trichoderma lentiforme]